MSSNNSVGNDLFLKLKSHFPKIRLGDKQGMSTVDPSKAVFFDFDFTVAQENIASVSISIADEGEACSRIQQKSLPILKRKISS